MNQTQLKKHLGVSIGSIQNAVKNFREGREFSYEHKGQPGKERKVFAADAIRRLEERFGVPKEKRYRPPDALEANWRFFKSPPNPLLVYIKNIITGEIARMRVNSNFKDRFNPTTRIPDDRIEETTKPRSRAGTIWTRIPPKPEREFAHNAQYPKPFSGKYGVQLWDGTMV